MKRTQAIRLEVRAILSSPKFERSSVLSSILDYLAEAELAGRDPPTQELIAADVFGKDLSQWDPADSSVRVAVSRLRAALEDYYLVHQPADGHCVHIRKGEYRLRFAAVGLAYPNIAAIAKRDKAPTDQGGRLATHECGHGVGSYAPAAAIDLTISSRDLGGSDLHNGLVEPPSSSAQSTHTIAIADSAALSDEKLATADPGQTPGPIWKQPLTNLVARAERFEAVSGLTTWSKLVGSVAVLIAAVWSAMNLQPARTAVAAIGQRQTLEVPYVAANIEFDGKASPDHSPADLIDELDDEVSKLLRKSMISRFQAAAGAKAPDFTLNINVVADERGYAGYVVLSDIQSRTVAERSFSPVTSVGELKDTVNNEIVAAISPNGHIARSLSDKIGNNPHSSFECFLLIEGMRATVEDHAQTLDRCLADYKGSEFIPHLEARKAFTAAQKTLMSGSKLSPDDESWRTVSRLLAEHPENPYANTVAAKLLIGRGMCRDAASFASDAFSRGRTYPTLELSVIVDAYGCDDTANLRSFWKGRIAKIAQAHPDPDPLTESYLTLGALITDQPDLLQNQKSTLFTSSINPALNELNNALRRLAMGRASEQDLLVVHDRLPTMIFHAGTRDMVLSKGNLRSNDQSSLAD